MYDNRLDSLFDSRFYFEGGALPWNNILHHIKNVRSLSNLDKNNSFLAISSRPSDLAFNRGSFVIFLSFSFTDRPTYQLGRPVGESRHLRGIKLKKDEAEY